MFHHRLVASVWIPMHLIARSTFAFAKASGVRRCRPPRPPGEALLQIRERLICCISDFEIKLRYHPLQ
jgi:hypothetical protein